MQSDPDDQPEFLTIIEIAKRLRIGRNQAYKAAENGDIPGVVRVGRTLRVRRSEFEKFGRE